MTTPTAEWTSADGWPPPIGAVIPYTRIIRCDESWRLPDRHDTHDTTSPLWRWCDKEFTATLDLPYEPDGHHHDRMLVEVYRQAKAAGWTITQDHDGTIHATCPGQGTRLPTEVLT